MITVQEVISAIQDGNPEQTVVICAEVWAGRHPSNSHVSIYDGERSYKANSLESAFKLYLSEKQAKQPAAADAEVEAVLGALPQEETAVQS